MKKQIDNESVREAGIFIRLAAATIDFSVLLFFTRFTIDRFDLTSIIPDLMQFQDLIIGVHFYLIFTVVPHSIFSQTIGQMIFKIKVVDNKLKRLGLFQCFTRDVILMPMGFLTSWMMFFGKRTALHDRIVGSLVVEAK